MPTWLKSRWAIIAGSFWFLPIAIALAAIVAALLLAGIDRSLATAALEDQWFYPQFGPDGARAILSAIAGGMMTMASLVFSLTFVGLTLISGQLGPRILMLFMRDKATQIVLGMFVGVFLFALIALSEVTELADGFVPHLSVAVAMVSATAAFGLVIYFVHHMATSIQADVIVAQLGGRFRRAVEKITARADTLDLAAARRAAVQFDGFGGEPVPAPQSAYVLHVDYSALIRLAEEGGLRIDVLARPDDFIGAGMPMLRVEGAEPDIEALAATITLGDRRNILQEATYEARALVEVAVRALSAGVNDPHTAVAAIDHLSAGLLVLVRCPGIPEVLFDETGRPCLRRPDLGLRHYLEVIVPAILADAGNDMLATERLIAMLRLLREVARQPHHVEMIAFWQRALADDVAHHNVPQALRSRLQAQASEALEAGPSLPD